MKVMKIATAGMLATVLVGATAVPQLVAIAPVYAEEATVANAQEAAQLSFIEGTAEKNEVVYASMTATGAVKDLYVVNELFSETPVMVKDFGAYESVINLTDEATLAHEPDNVVCVIEEGSFVYQGNLATHDLPWRVDISYTLDGEAIDPTQLAGRSGELKIAIDTQQNPLVDPIYFENYLVQISATLPLDRASYIEAEGGSVALAGSDTTVSFMVLPGKAASFELTAHVEDFEMEGISIAAIPFTMAFDLPDSESLVAQFDELIEGANALDLGAQKLAEGTSDLQKGTTALHGGAAQLRSGVGELNEGVAAYTDGVSQASEGLRASAAGSQIFAAQLDALSTASDGILASLVASEKQISDLEESIKNSSLSPDEQATLLAQTNGLKARLTAMKDYTTNVKALPDGYAQLDSSLNQLADGMNELENQGAQLSGGVINLDAGAHALADSTGVLNSGVEQLEEGSRSLADGTAELAEESARIPEKVQAEIDAMMADFDKQDFTPTSFVDSRNTQVDLVQFVMATEAVHAPEVEVEEPEPEDESLLSRFFALFS